MDLIIVVMKLASSMLSTIASLTTGDVKKGFLNF